MVSLFTSLWFRNFSDHLLVVPLLIFVASFGLVLVVENARWRSLLKDPHIQLVNLHIDILPAGLALLPLVSILPNVALSTNLLSHCLGHIFSLTSFILRSGVVLGGGRRFRIGIISWH